MDKFYAPVNEQGIITHLWTNSPNVMVRALWYETVPFNLFLIFGYILLAVISIILWIRSFCKKSAAGRKSVFAKFIAILYALTVLVIFTGLTMVFTNLHPEYDIPYILLENSSTYDILSYIVWILPVWAILLFISVLMVWIKRSLRIGGRIYYTFFTLWSAGIIWWLYWNILKW
jgi:hypothetical protein